MFKLESPYQQPHFSIDRGVECLGTEYTCINNGDTSKVRIIKRETNDLAYKVSLIYHGLEANRPSWTLRINDKLPMTDNGFLSYCGSKIFVFKPADKKIIEVQETDENGTTSLWIDLSQEIYKVRLTYPTVSEKIQTVIEMGKVFQL